jgi:Fe-S-cluster containining protein
VEEKLPENFSRIGQEDLFSFSCHPSVPCFTECCRQLDLALSPYDVLRLKNRLKMHSGDFLEQYVIIEMSETEPFPSCYLTMVDDGQASCIFVTKQGCSVYEDRPGPCRAYPVGRGAALERAGSLEEHYVLVREQHCLGFCEPTGQQVRSYLRNQGLASYNLFNDLLLKIIQHDRIRQGFRPALHQLDQFILALFNLDMFRQEMADGRLKLNRSLTPRNLRGLAGDDEELLKLGIQWLSQELFAEELVC